MTLAKPMDLFEYKNSNSTTNLSLVLDLDSTLIYTAEDEDVRKLKKICTSHTELIPRIYKLNVVTHDHENDQSHYREMWGIKRPHLQEFLNFIFGYFKYVFIWSAGIGPYVDEITRVIGWNKLQHRFKDVWARDRCVINEKNYTKPLSLLLDHGISMESVFILDDNTYTFDFNRENGILIPAYAPKINLEDILRDDTALLELIAWLQKPMVRKSTNVKELDKSNIFS